MDASKDQLKAMWQFKYSDHKQNLGPAQSIALAFAPGYTLTFR